LPAGTGNVLARDLKLPLDQEGAIALAAGPGPHELRSLDAMEVDGRYFFLNLGVGLNAAVMRDTTPREKRAFGAAAYVWTAVRKAVVPHQASFRVVVDGEETRSRASDVIIMNSPAIGGPALRLDPKACPDDGRLEVFIIQSRGLGEYLLLASRVLLGWQRIDRRFFQRNCYREVQVTTKPSLPVQADGEALGETPIRVELRSKAVQVVVPPLKEGGKRPLQALLGLARQEKEERG
jgi:diacylglycerol kinase (ATP)